MQPLPPPPPPLTSVEQKVDDLSTIFEKISTLAAPGDLTTGPPTTLALVTDLNSVELQIEVAKEDHSLSENIPGLRKRKRELIDQLQYRGCYEVQRAVILWHHCIRPSGVVHKHHAWRSSTSAPTPRHNKCGVPHAGEEGEEECSTALFPSVKQRGIAWPAPRKSTHGVVLEEGGGVHAVVCLPRRRHAVECRPESQKSPEGIPCYRPALPIIGSRKTDCQVLYCDLCPIWQYISCGHCYRPRADH